MPRSLARTAVHPPHRIGNPRSSKPLNTFVCILLTVVVSVLGGIVYFLIDIEGSEESFTQKHQQNKDTLSPLPKHFGSFTDQINDQIKNPTKQLTTPGVPRIPNIPNIPNIPIEAQTPKIDLPINQNSNDNSANNGKKNEIQENNIDSQVDVVLRRLDLETLVRPDRVHIRSVIDPDRLVDITPNNAGGDQNGEDGDDGDGGSLSLDEPEDEKEAIHLLRKDIEPENKECLLQFEQLSKGLIFGKNLSLQANKFSNAQTSDDYIDWWDFPIQYQRKLENGKYCNTIHKGLYELHETRKDWFKKMQKDNKVSHLNSNKFDENGCVIYKKTDEYVQWHPPPQLLCHWKNTATFYHTMHGTKIGYDFR